MYPSMTTNAHDSTRDRRRLRGAQNSRRCPTLQNTCRPRRSDRRSSTMLAASSPAPILPSVVVDVVDADADADRRSEVGFALLARLERDIPRLRSFLASVHFAHERSRRLAVGSLYHPTRAFTLAKARYERTWMPLLASRAPGSPPLAPPLDVQWVHHLHRLDPEAYARDCERAFGRVVDPSGGDPFAFAGGDVDDAAERAAREAWRTAGSPWPFDLDDALDLDASDEISSADVVHPRDPAPDGAFSASCDLAASARRQGGFLWQVLPRRYADADFLRVARDRYLKFLGLRRARPDCFLVPTYDIDLAWHAHLSLPSAYTSDTAALCGGRLFPHDDSVDDRTPGAKLDVCHRDTEALWSLAYPGSTHGRDGGMWRGDPPDWYWSAAWRPECLLGPGPVTEAHVFPVPVPDPGDWNSPEIAPGTFYAPVRHDRAASDFETTRFHPSVIIARTSVTHPPFGREADPNIVYVKISLEVASSAAVDGKPTSLSDALGPRGDRWVAFDMPRDAEGRRILPANVSPKFVVPAGAKLPERAGRVHFVTPVDVAAVFLDARDVFRRNDARVAATGVTMAAGVACMYVRFQLDGAAWLFAVGLVLIVAGDLILSLLSRGFALVAGTVWFGRAPRPTRRTDGNAAGAACVSACGGRGGVCAYNKHRGVMGVVAAAGLLGGAAAAEAREARSRRSAAGAGCGAGGVVGGEGGDCAGGGDGGGGCGGGGCGGCGG